MEPGSERGDAVQIPSIRLIKMFLWICCGLIHSEALTLPPSGRGVVLPAVSFLNLFFNQIFEILIKIIYIYIVWLVEKSPKHSKLWGKKIIFTFLSIQRFFPPTLLLNFGSYTNNFSI